MFDSVFNEIIARPYTSRLKLTFTRRRCIPLTGVRNFECLKTQAFRLHSNIDSVSPPFDCDFSPHSPDHLLVAKEDGLVHLYDTSKHGPEALLKYYSVHENAIFSVKWVNYANQFLTGSGDQTIKLVDAETDLSICTYIGHKMSIRSIALWPKDDYIFASASRDGSIRLWDMRSHNLSGVGSSFHLQGCHLPISPAPVRRYRSASRRSGTDAHTITSIVFSREYELISAGSSDGMIKIWDIRKFVPSRKKPPQPLVCLPYKGVSKKKCGFSDLVLNSTRTRLFASCMDHNIYEYNLNSTSTRPVLVYSGHVTGSFYIKLTLSPDDMYLATGSADSRAYIYCIGQRTQHPFLLSGHQPGEVSVPRWCVHDPTRLVSLSDNAQLFVWRMYPAREYTMPVPGQHAGFTERRSQPTITAEHQNSLLVPPTPEKEPTGSSTSSVSVMIPSLKASIADTTSALAQRRRQMNIRNFLRDITAEPSEASDNTKRSAESSVSPTGEGPSEAPQMHRPPLSGSRIVHPLPFGHTSSNTPTPVFHLMPRDDPNLNDTDDTENDPSSSSSLSTGSQPRQRNPPSILIRPRFRRTTDIGHGASHLILGDISNPEASATSRKRPMESNDDSSEEQKSTSGSRSSNISEHSDGPGNASRDSRGTPRHRRRTLVPTNSATDSMSPSTPGRRGRRNMERHLTVASGRASIRNYFKPPETE